MASFSPLRPMLRAATSTPLTAAARCAQRSSPFSTSASRAFARLTLVGRLGSDPEISSTSTGQDLIRYTVATSYGPKDNRQTSWFRVTKFVPQEGAQRDYILGIQKGTMVCVEGDASMRSFEDSEGKKHSSLSVVQRSIEVLKRPYNAEAEAQEGSQ